MGNMSRTGGYDNHWKNSCTSAMHLQILNVEKYRLLSDIV